MMGRPAAPAALLYLHAAVELTELDLPRHSAI